MAWDFNNSYLRSGTFEVSPPFSMACWAIIDNYNDNVIFSIGQSTGYYYHSIVYRNSGIHAWTLAAANVGALSTYVPSEGELFHALAVFAADDDRRIYVNGRNKGTESTSNPKPV